MSPRSSRAFTPAAFPAVGATVWLLVNRSREDRSGKQLEVAHKEGTSLLRSLGGPRIEAAIARQCGVLKLRDRGAADMARC